MAQTATAYFNGLKAYLNKQYKVTQPDHGKIVLKEKIYPPGGSDLQNYMITLNYSGDAFAIKLDRYSTKKLFDFLDNESKPWSKRCDFVIFHCYRNKVNAHCIEFKSGTFPEKLVDQLKASAAWCHSLHSTVSHYTGNSRKLNIAKYVFSCHQKPELYLDEAGEYLLKDHSVRHYLYDDVDMMNLEDLVNANMEVAK